uniref:Uncharacterized protein n=1 Tax=Zea mays TaxID=4577 RepID=A0A804MTM6_MAIZE
MGAEYPTFADVSRARALLFLADSTPPPAPPSPPPAHGDEFYCCSGSSSSYSAASTRSCVSDSTQHGRPVDPLCVLSVVASLHLIEPKLCKCSARRGHKRAVPYRGREKAEGRVDRDRQLRRRQPDREEQRRGQRREHRHGRSVRGLHSHVGDMPPGSAGGLCCWREEAEGSRRDHAMVFAAASWAGHRE